MAFRFAGAGAAVDDRSAKRVWATGAALGAAALVGAFFAINGANAQAADGATLFNTVGCSACHGTNGEGGAGPALANNAELADAGHVVNQILHGGGIMPAFGDTLSDDQIAALANYVRTSFGNANTDTIDVATVTTARAAPPAAATPAPAAAP